MTTTALMSINLLGLKPSLRSRLKEKGYHVACHIVKAGPIRIASDLEISRVESLKLIRDVQKRIGGDTVRENDVYLR